MRLDVPVDYVQVVEVVESLGGLPQHRQGVEGLFRRERDPALYVVVEGRLAQLEGNVPEQQLCIQWSGVGGYDFVTPVRLPELAVLLHAEVPDHIGVNIRFPEKLHLAIGDAEAIGEDSLYGHVAIVEATAVYESALTALAQDVLGVEGDLAHLN